MFECLGERTVALAQQARMKNPESGYDPSLDQLAASSEAQDAAREQEEDPAAIRQEIEHSAGVSHGEAQHCFHHAPHTDSLDTPREQGNA